MPLCANNCWGRHFLPIVLTWKIIKTEERVLFCLNTDMEVVIEMTVVTELTMIVRNLQQNMVLVDTMSFSIDGRSDISQNTSVEETLTLCYKNV